MVTEKCYTNFSNNYVNNVLKRRYLEKMSSYFLNTKGGITENLKPRLSIKTKF